MVIVESVARKVRVKSLATIWTETGPVQARVEVAVAVKVVRPQEDVQVAHGVDDLEFYM